MPHHGATWFPDNDERRAIDAERRFDDAIQENEKARAELRTAIGVVKNINLEAHWLERALMRQLPIHVDANDGITE